jgi:phosphatidylinositol glycan class B
MDGLSNAAEAARTDDCMTSKDNLTRSRRVAFVTLSAVLLAGLALRAGLAIAYPSVYHPDEVFQTLEPAHHLATGWGFVTWEWRDGIRSWLLPGVLAGLMSLAGGRDAEPEAYLALIAIVFSLASLSIVAVAAAAGRRLAGTPGLAIAGAAAAVWYELVYFGPKTLTEAVAADVLVVAVYLATVVAADDMPASRRRRLLALLGFLMALIFWLRFHLAPALPFIAVWACRAQVRDRWLPLIAGTAIPLSALGMTDWLTWGTPFQSVWKNFWVNIVEDCSSGFGTSPFHDYVIEQAGIWRWATIPIVAATCVGARRLPLFAFVAAVIIASMSVVPHKELRFIFPAVALVIVLAGVGTAIVIEHWRPQSWPDIPAWLRSGAGILAWSVTSAVIATGGAWPALTSPSPSIIQAETYLHGRPDLCGVGILGFPWWLTSGYTRLQRPVPVTDLATAKDLLAHASSVNWVLANADLVFAARVQALLKREDMPKFITEQCWGKICVLHRQGACAPMNGWDINAQLRGWNM